MTSHRFPGPHPLSRRTALRGALSLGALPLAAGLAGCGGHSSTTPRTTAAPSTTPAATASATASSTASAGASASVDASLPYLSFPVPAGAKPAHTLQVLLDFRCPYCKIFADTQGAELRQRAEAGTLAVQIAPRPMLDSMLPGDYSLHTAAAYTAAFAQDPQLAWDAEKTLFERQVAEDADAPDMDTILGWLTPLGLSEDSAEAARSGSYDSWLTDTVEKHWRGLDLGTPTLFLDGTEVADRDWSDPSALTALLGS